MTTYISENEFVNNELYLSNPYPFLAKNNTIEYNKNYGKEESVLKILAIDDTFHDLTQDRNGYDNKLFNEAGPLNYLLTGQFIKKNELDYYKKKLNYDEFSNIPGKFESKVARSIEIKKGLQSADIRISYDEIMNNITISGNNVTISDNLYKKAKSSNGSLNLFINTDHPSIKKMDADRMSFSNFMIAYTKNNIKLINENYLKIAYFVKWYLHSPDLDDSNFLKTNEKNIKMKIPDESMKILSDAGISFLGDFLSVPNSGATPFIAVPCFLDSASTSISPLDTNVDVVFENMSQETIVPIVSNYFSSHEYFMCYILNEKSDFDINNLYNFSLALFKIDAETRKHVIDIRNNESTNNEYKKACVAIKDYIDANPELVARYYFGEAQKNKEEDTAKCGTCGAGVPYIGKIMNMLIKVISNKSYQKINAGWLDNSVKSLKNELNRLKNEGSLNGRIPFSDSRILKLFCKKTFQKDKPIITLNINKPDLESLFKLLADYKRTGDYQQSYTVLKEILKDGNNAKCYTFTSGDELSTLIGRLLAVPSIYQIGSTGSCYLYRCNLLNASENEKLALQLKNHINNYENYLLNIKNKYETITEFISIYYEKICKLRNDLFTLLENKKDKKDNIDIFVKVRLFNACSHLTDLIKHMNAFNVFAQNNSYQKIITENEFIRELQASLIRIRESMNNKKQKSKGKKSVFDNLIDEEMADEFILDALIAELLDKFDDMDEFDKNFVLYNIINVNYYSFISEKNTDLFNSIENNTTFVLPELNLNIKNSEDEDKLTKSLIKYVISYNEKTQTTQTRTQRSSVIASVSQKQEMDNALLINNYNAFINSMNNNILDNYKISNISELSSILQKLQEEIPKYTESKKNITCSKIIDQQEPKKISPKELSPPESPAKPIPIPELRRSTRFQSKLPAKSGGDIYNQSGGTIQDYNKFCIYNDIKKALMNLMSKCYCYMSNVTPLNNEQNNTAVIMRSITDNYDANDFCNTLLFQNDSELQNDVNGFIIELKTIVDKYTYSDILENGSDTLLTIDDMLTILNLPYIKLIIYMLSWSNISTILLSSESISFDIVEYFKQNKFMDEEDIDEIISESNNSKLLTAFNNMLLKMKQQYSEIYTYLHSLDVEMKINSLFTILCLANIFNIYYHDSKSLQNNTIAKFYGIYDTRLLKNYIEDSPREFLQSHFGILLNNVSSLLITKLGLSKSRTGPYTGTKKHGGSKSKKTRKIHKSK